MRRAEDLISSLRAGAAPTGAKLRDVVNEVYADGVVSRAEAEALFQLNDRLGLVDVRWPERFTEAVCDFLLTRQPPERWVTETEADWVLNQVRREGALTDDTEVDLLIRLLSLAEGAPTSLAIDTLALVRARVEAQGRITSDEADRIRRLIHAAGGCGSAWVSRAEANALFALNDAVAFARNAPEWNRVFARAIANHLMAATLPDPNDVEEALRRETWLADTDVDVFGFLTRMATSFGNADWFEKVGYDADAEMKARANAKHAAAQKQEQIDDGENRWFLQRLGWDKSISPAERELIRFLKDHAPNFSSVLVEQAA